MSHHHHHHDHAAGIPAEALGKVLLWGIILNLGYVIFEAAAGFRESSLGLLSDAGHNLSDVLSLALSWIAIRLAAIPASRRFTYGYRKAGILIALVNAMLLLVAVGGIAAEAIRSLSNPAEVNGAAVSLVAGIGIVVNALTAFLLMRHSRSDVNIKGAFLHMAADALVSVGVVVSGVIIHFTGLGWIDPAVSLVIAAVILASTIALLVESLRLALDAVPESVDREKVESILSSDANVAGWHHLHIWALSTSENALTVHLVLKDISGMEGTKATLRAALKDAGITHPTFETESEGTSCEAGNCPAQQSND